MANHFKYSHQREAIVNFLKTRTDHPTADVVYQNIRKDLPNISLATVYRNLNKLADAGCILRLHVDGKTDHYDACTDDHAHLLCRNCGCVCDINISPNRSLLKEARMMNTYCIDDVTVLFAGLCSCCRENAFNHGKIQSGHA